MTPKEKAIELFDFYYQCGDCPTEWAKDNANKVADEVINTIMSVYQPITKEFWFEVKKEIEKL